MLQSKQKEIELAVRSILIAIGEDPDREDLKETPGRYAKAILGFSPQKEEPVMTTFLSNSNGLVLVKNLEVRSLCGHHLFPFVGRASVAYFPKEKKLGLSKFQRALDFIANKPQDQEKLTSELMAYLIGVLEPHGIIIKLSCNHTCMSARGVKCHEAETITLEHFGECSRLGMFQSLVSML